MKIDSVVVLYNPEEIILKNILSYISFIDKLYIVDNSDVKKYDLIEKIVAVSPKWVMSQTVCKRCLKEALYSYQII